ncbi:hypothetical protein BN975_05562 [Mycolicibacterium farcinogenes]|nr:hypothetical protein BN975_05562 [Mycolicibacterium farcinogenes]
MTRCGVARERLLACTATLPRAVATVLYILACSGVHSTAGIAPSRSNHITRCCTSVRAALTRVHSGHVGSSTTMDAGPTSPALAGRAPVPADEASWTGSPAAASPDRPARMLATTTKAAARITEVAPRTQVNQRCRSGKAPSAASSSPAASPGKLIGTPSRRKHGGLQDKTNTSAKPRSALRFPQDANPANSEAKEQGPRRATARALGRTGT